MKVTLKVSGKGSGWRVSDLAFVGLECGDKTTVRQPRRSACQRKSALRRTGRTPFRPRQERSQPRKTAYPHAETAAAITSFLDCGDLHADFTRRPLPDCGDEFLLAFSYSQSVSTRRCPR